MKKIYTLIGLLIVASSGFAQQFHFGLKFSPGIYWVSTDATATESNGAKLGYNYGAVAEFAFTDNYAFATGIDVSTKAGSFIRSDSTKLGLDFNIQYLEIPLTIKMKTNEIGYLKYYGQFGVNLGFNLTGSYEGDEIVRNSTTGVAEKVTYSKTKFDNKSRFESSFFRPALVIGAGIEYNLTGSTNLLAGISWDNGFLDVLDNKNNAPEVKIKGILINLGILF